MPDYYNARPHDDIIVDKPTVTKLWGFESPAPPMWRVEGFVREKYVALVAAQGGTGKSFLALYLALCVSLGIPFFGRQTRRSRVLYLDFEMDEEEQKRRLSRIAAGLGIPLDDDRLTDHLFYYRAKHPLSTEKGFEELRQRVDFYGVEFVVLDSLTFSLGAADASAARDVVPLLMGIQNLGVSGLILDHFAKTAAQGNHAHATPFGSTMKFAVARAVYNLSRTDGGGLLLQSTKSNFGPKADALCYEMEFEGELGPVRFHEVDRTDASMAGSFRHMKSNEVTLLAIAALHEETGAPVTQQQVVAWREELGDDGLAVGLGGVRNHFTELKKLGKITPTEDGGYVPTETKSDGDDAPEDDVAENDPFIVHRSIGGMNDERPSDGEPDRAQDTDADLAQNAVLDLRPYLNVGDVNADTTPKMAA